MTKEMKNEKIVLSKVETRKRNQKTVLVEAEEGRKREVLEFWG